jgi:hypothetical protein
MDRWAWEQLDPWLQLRAGLPVGALFMRALRTNPWPLLLPRRHAHAAAKRRPGGTGAPPIRAAPASPRPRRRDVPRRSPGGVIHRQLGHADLGITST